MNRSIDLTQLGGLYEFQSTLPTWLQLAIQENIDALSAGIGDKYVLNGCVDTGNNVSNGWIIYNGECLPFIGGVKGNTPQIQIQQTTTSKQFNDGTTKNVMTVKQAALVSLGDFPYSDLKRLPLNNLKLFEQITSLHSLITKAIGFEDTVILSGCNVFNVNTGASTLSIGAGAILMGDQIVTCAQYDGVYPVYLASDGSWTTNAPTGYSIYFNPYTSQYYKDVLKRAITPPGEIKMFETLSDRFDLTTGLGKWEMLGFQLKSEMQNRMPIGLWYDNTAVANVTDDNNKVAGNQGGEKAHTLTQAELPEVIWEQPVKVLPQSGNANECVAPLSNASTQESIEIVFPGGGEAHNNMAPYTIVVYVKRLNN